MKVRLTDKAKRELLNNILLESIKESGLTDASLSYYNDTYPETCDTYIVKKNVMIIEREGILRKSQRREELITKIVSIKGNAIPYTHVFSGGDWNAIEIESHAPEYDELAESIAKKLTPYVPNLTLSINSKLKVEELKNPSSR